MQSSNDVSFKETPISQIKQVFRKIKQFFHIEYIRNKISNFVENYAFCFENHKTNILQSEELLQIHQRFKQLLGVLLKEYKQFHQINDDEFNGAILYGANINEKKELNLSLAAMYEFLAFKKLILNPQTLINPILYTNISSPVKSARVKDPTKRKKSIELFQTPLKDISVTNILEPGSRRSRIIGEVKKEILCPICGDVLWMAKKCSKCPMHVCCKCLISIAKQNETCPGCKEGLIYSSPSENVMNLLSKLIFKCKNSPRCRVFLSYDELEFHLCPYEKINCYSLGCTIKVLRKYLNKHRLICDFKEVHCRFEKQGCKEFMKRKKMKKHQQECPFAIHFDKLSARTENSPQKTELSFESHTSSKTEKIKDIQAFFPTDNILNEITKLTKKKSLSADCTLNDNSISAIEKTDPKISRLEDIELIENISDSPNRCGYCHNEALKEQLSSCDTCELKVCIICISYCQCKLCNKKVCPRCIKTCYECQKTFSPDCIIECQCEITPEVFCKEKMCKICISYCKDCGKYVCNKHSGKLLSLCPPKLTCIHRGIRKCQILC